MTEEDIESMEPPPEEQEVDESMNADATIDLDSEDVKVDVETEMEGEPAMEENKPEENMDLWSKYWIHLNNKINQRECSLLSSTIISDHIFCIASTLSILECP